ncbi:hypothetical protein G9G63_09015 [Paenibacillus sp. EKM202P]|uniref:hypothetical protein n=1 Tax=unclassified Paenibacillus TaxID=185978 RepID=UPI0013EAD656|nr:MULTISPECIES: hypothetical protein [unclassified Paenibacillus]KAF6565290.1 hypothetical protein G9G63_09015 [Paenibacillus sp. EKM202P]KAF6569384.1 hypothetical protein G9G64_13075 [Paenibacillus sp. EKM207P]
MKISNNVIDKYKELCPHSYLKCDSITDVEFKIKRAVVLGCQIKQDENGEKLIQYYYNCFVVKDNNVIDMFKNMNEYIEVREKVKNAYNKLEGKLLV